MEKMVYKIVNAEGEFSLGGQTPSFGPKGKIWTSRGAVSNHLSQIDRMGEQVYRDNNANVVSYVVVEEEKDHVFFEDWKLARSTVRAKEIQEERRIKRQKEYKQNQIQRLEDELKRLKAKT